MIVISYSLAIKWLKIVLELKEILLTFKRNVEVKNYSEIYNNSLQSGINNELILEN